MTEFAIVTVIHDSAAEIEGLLASIERFLDPRPQVVVVDSGSRDDGAEVARRHGAEVIVLEDNRGFGAASNAGLERVAAPVTALVNPDVELLDAGLLRLVAEAETRTALLVPRLLNADGSVQDSAHPLPGTLEALIPAAVPRPLLPRPLRRRYEPWRSTRPRAVGWAIAACVVARTELPAPRRAVRRRRLPLLRGPRAVPARRRSRCAHPPAPLGGGAPPWRNVRGARARRRCTRAGGQAAPRWCRASASERWHWMTSPRR